MPEILEHKIKKIFTFFPFILLIFLPALLSAYSFYSPSWREELHSLRQNNKIIIEETPLIRNTISVTAADTVLQDTLDYTVNYQNGEITFSDHHNIVKVVYAVYPQALQNWIYNFIPQQSDLSKVKKIEKKTLSPKYEDLHLKVKGSKTVSISVSEGQNFQLDQSLYLQIEGELGKNVNIQAQVTDSESPITPEGSSSEISNLDRIFIRLYGNHYELGFGDLDFSFEDSYFLDYSPVYEGLQAGWTKENKIVAGIGLARAASSSQQINGIEGRQGPYFLSNSFSGDALIVAGSEKVYLNGTQMQRGIDYSIDYSEGSLTFSEKHFISSTDRIYTTFQYSSEHYRQNVYMAETDYYISENFLIKGAFFHQKDDADNPLSRQFSESDLDSLAAAGDDNAFGSGIYETEKGLGAYILTEQGFFQYVGLDSTGTYNLAFYEDAAGDYILAEVGTYYIFVGNGNGNYSLGTKLEPPVQKANYVMKSRFTKGEIALNAEILLSDYDRNLKSAADDDDNAGLGIYTRADWHKKGDKVSPYADFSWLYQGKGLFTFDPVANAADYYDYSAVDDSLEQSELSFRTGINFLNIAQPEINIKKLKAENSLEQLYLRSNLQVWQQKYLPAFNYSYLSWERQISSADTTSWFSHSASADYTLGSWKAGGSYKFEKRDNPLMPLKNEEKKIFLEFNRSNRKARIYWQKNKADSLYSSDKEIKTAGVMLGLKGVKHTLELNFAHRTVKDSISSTYDIGSLQYRGDLWQLLSLNSSYSLRTLDFYPRLRELVYVGSGEGNYNEDGEEEEDGDYIWQTVQIDYNNPQEALEIIAAAGLQINPQSNYSPIFQRMHLDFNLSRREQSTSSETLQLYLLQGSQLMQDDTTVLGTENWRSSFWYDIVKSKLKFRLTTSAENRLDNRYQEREKTSRKSYEMNLLWRKSHTWNWELALENRHQEDSRLNLISQGYTTALETRFTPHSSQVYSSRIAYIAENDEDESGEYDYKLNSLTLELTARWFPRSGSRFYNRLKYRYNVAKGDQYASWQEENRAGNVLIINLSYDHRISSFVTLSASYEGRSIPDEDFSNELELELEARF